VGDELLNKVSVPAKDREQVLQSSVIHSAESIRTGRFPVDPVPAAVVAAHAPAVVAVAAPEASYVAKTRGAVHVAPLPGHVQSAASVNLEPAPGTW